jgi:hypothetical protein
MVKACLKVEIPKDNTLNIVDAGRYLAWSPAIMCHPLIVLSRPPFLASKYASNAALTQLVLRSALELISIGRCLA